MLTIVEFWHGGFPLGHAFGSGAFSAEASLACLPTLLAMMLLAAGAPAWLAVLVFAGHIPWNLMLLVGRLAQRRTARGQPRCRQSRAAWSFSPLARLVILAWVVVLSIL